MSRPSRSLTGPLLMLLLLVGAVGLLLFPRLGPPSGLWWHAGWNALHFPGFVLVTIGLERVLSLGIGCRTRRIVLATAGSVFLAVGSEIVQDSLGRSSSLGDVVFDLIGTAFGAVVLMLAPRLGARGRWGLAGAGVLIVLVLLTPGWRGMLAAAEHRAAFPDLGAFSEGSSLARWRPQGGATLSLDRESATLTVRTTGADYSGVSCYPAQQDWSGHEGLTVVIDNPGEPFSLGIRVDDASPLASRHGERYNGSREIAAGRNELRVPLAEIAAGPAHRSLDLERVKRLALFTGNDGRERVFTVVSAFLD